VLFHNVNTTDEVVAHSAIAKTRLKQLGVFRKITLLKMGIDIDSFRPAYKSDKSGQIRQLNLLYVGRLDPLKGIDLILKSLIHLKDFRVKLELVFFKPGKDEESYLGYIQKLIQNLPKNHKVTIIWEPKLKEMVSLYQKADASLLPSCSESFGLSVIESLACGTPVFATPVGEAVYLLDKIDRNLLITRDPRVIYQKIEWFASLTANQLGLLRKKCRQAVLGYDQKKYLRDFSKLLGI
jgi:D-inositol-3-phosphate glycosyltransferase